MWLINSSIGRKVVMSVTGIALILFLTFHCCMNVVALFSGKAYNMICELLGANWYALVATLGLAALAVCHIVYAFILTAQNRRARGASRYEVTVKPEKVEWASQNMLVLGIIILLGLLLHLFNFWYNMMFAELTGMAPRSRFLEFYADPRRKWQGMVQALAVHQRGLHQSAHVRLCSSGSGFCLQLCPQPLLNRLSN